MVASVSDDMHGVCVCVCSYLTYAITFILKSINAKLCNIHTLKAMIFLLVYVIHCRSTHSQVSSLIHCTILHDHKVLLHYYVGSQTITVIFWEHDHKTKLPIKYEQYINKVLNVSKACVLKIRFYCNCVAIFKVAWRNKE